MAACPHLTFQVLTKRAKRMREWFEATGIAARVDFFKHVALAGRIEEFFAPEREAAIDGWPGYWITSKGRVLSDHKGPRRELSPEGGEAGHSRVMLYRGERGEETWRPLIHRLVLGAFDRSGVATADADVLQGCHIDGNPRNNALWNLRWGTQASNRADSKRHGTARRYSKLTAEQVAEIRRLSAAGVSGEELGRRFGVSATQARNIVSGRHWPEPSAPEWPLRSVWLGVSVEDQERADERVPHLLATPAAVRFLSAEPLLGPIRLGIMPWGDDGIEVLHGEVIAHESGCVAEEDGPRIDWVIVGGESGRRARRFEINWARSIVERCRAADVPVFVKQLGANPVLSLDPSIVGIARCERELVLNDPKGGDPAEWPEDLRVREFPEARS